MPRNRKYEKAQEIQTENNQYNKKNTLYVNIRLKKEKKNMQTSAK